jgi:hypothetical protein
MPIGSGGMQLAGEIGMAGVTGGTSMLIPLLGSLFSGLGAGIFGSQESAQEKSMKEAFDMIKKQLPNASKMAFSKEEINTLVKTMQSIYRGGANVAAGQIGSAIGESGATPGQGFAEYYTQSLAPVIAEGENKAAGAVGWGEQAYSDNYNQAQSRVNQLLQLLTGAASGQASQTGTQKGIASGLQGMNLFATGYGNLMKGWKDYNNKTPGVGGY